MRVHLRRVVCVTVVLLLAGCAGGGVRQPQTLQTYLDYAGAPIKSFTWLGSFYSWEGLSKNQLVVFTTPSDAYLLTIAPPCDMRFVINNIGLTSTGGTVYARLDSVVTDSQATGRWNCPINEIRPIDYRRMRADGRAKAQAARPSGAPAGAAPANPPPQQP